MQRITKKIVTLSILFLFAGVMLAPAVFAQEVVLDCDKDLDGYLAVPAAAMAEVDATYNENGTYNLLQWQNYFSQYKNAVAAGQLLPEETCGNLNFAKGLEPTRCDAPIVSPASGVYDTGKVSSLAGNTVNPEAFDIAGNGIDENCDGTDGKLVPAVPGGEKDLGGLTEKIIMYASRAVIAVSVLIMIWGGFLYATAAGDEMKTGKARKAIIGAIIGLVVGLLAPTIVNYIVASLA
ncbi:hypothetical protein JXA05_02110 [Candidatus Peregrinibacteria bacterium]|nr:hypothetical protein [Candidatus Peregrinibacteria bacterium]